MLNLVNLVACSPTCHPVDLQALLSFVLRMAIRLSLLRLSKEAKTKDILVELTVALKIR